VRDPEQTLKSRPWNDQRPRVETRRTGDIGKAQSENRRSQSHLGGLGIRNDRLEHKLRGKDESR
jgi:hypothetical protein